MTCTPVPVYYVVDDPHPDSISNTFSDGRIARGRSEGHVYDQPDVDFSRRPYVVMDNANGVHLINRLYYIAIILSKMTVAFPLLDV